MSNILKEIKNFNQADFEEQIHILANSDNFIGYANDNESLEMVLLWRNFFIPSSFFGHLIAKNISIVSEFRGLKDIWITDSMGVCKNSIEALDTQIRINNAKENNEPIFAFFGGSTIQGVGSFLPNFTIPALVERILLIDYNIKSVCINHGVAGWSSSDELNYLLHEINYNPNYCIFYDGWNCVWNLYNGILINEHSKKPNNIKWMKGTSLRHLEYDHQNSLQFSITWHFSKFFNLFINKSLLYLSRFFNRKSFSLFVSNISSTLFPQRRINVFNNLENITLSDELLERILFQIANEYLRIDQIANIVCQNRGIKFLHLMQPTLLTTTRTLTIREMKLLEIGESTPNPEVFSLFNKFVSKIGLPDHMIDISNTFNNIDEEVFQDDGHLNHIGNYHVAMKIVQEILKKWPIPAN